MDNLTHTLTGLMLARAGAAKGVPRAGLLLMLAANAPDFDIVSWFGGTLTYLEYHRWFTHAILAAPLMGAVAAGITRLFVRGPFPWRRALLGGLIGVASHLLLDWTNVYGIRLLLPFSPRWLRLDITSIVDPWIWTLLFIALLAPALGRLVSSEIGAKPGSGRGWAIFALLAMSAYECGRYVAHDRAVAVLDAHTYGGSAPARVAAFATFWNPLRWRGVVESSDAYRVYALDLARDFNPSQADVVFKAEPNPAIVAASRNPAFQRFLSFSSFPLWRATPVPEPDGATQVQLFDLRFGEPRQPGFVTSAIVNRSGEVEPPDLSFGRPRAR